MKESLYKVQWLRRLAIPLLKTAAVDISVRHHWVPGARIKLNSYKHKGYWYHGKKREHRTLTLISKLLEKGQTVIEVGGHIGYFSLFFAHFTHPNGKVIVFEPGSNNLPYIRKNITQAGSHNLSAVELVEAAAGPSDTEMTLYEEDLTGQNNSLVKDFSGLSNNLKQAHVQANVKPRTVSVRAIDSLGIAPAFIKIDVEGFELGVLEGARETISNSFPVVMVEVQADHKDIFEYFERLGYLMFDDSMRELQKPDELRLNVFCLQETAHAELIERLRSEALIGSK